MLGKVSLAGTAINIIFSLWGGGGGERGGAELERLELAGDEKIIQDKSLN